MMKQDVGSVRRLGMGCWLLVGLVAIGAIVVMYGFWQIWSTVSDFEQRYLEAGYTVLEGVTIDVSEPIQENTYIYARDTVRIQSGAQASLAVSAHEAFISGTVAGDVAFLGGDLEISEGAIIEGSVDVTMAHNVVVRGVVQGGISGTWTRLYGQGHVEAAPDNGNGTGADVPATRDVPHD